MKASEARDMAINAREQIVKEEIERVNILVKAEARDGYTGVYTMLNDGLTKEDMKKIMNHFKHQGFEVSTSFMDFRSLEINWR